MKSPPLYLGKWFEEGHTISLDFVATKAALSNSRLHAWLDTSRLISPAMRIFLFILLNDGINCWGNNCSYHVITFREALSTSVWVFFLVISLSYKLRNLLDWKLLMGKFHLHLNPFEPIFWIFYMFF